MPNNSTKIEKYLLCIGQVTHSAAAIDMMLCNVFRIISGFDNATAIAIYYMPDGTPLKIRLLRHMISVHCDAEEETLINRMIKHAQTANGHRNEMAHSFLHIETDKSLTRIYPRDRQQHKQITNAYLDAQVTPTLNAMREAGDLYAELCNKRKVSFVLQF